jgi:hypothetical protein
MTAHGPFLTVNPHMQVKAGRDGQATVVAGLRPVMCASRRNAGSCLWLIHGTCRQGGAMAGGSKLICIAYRIIVAFVPRHVANISPFDLDQYPLNGHRE